MVIAASGMSGSGLSSEIVNIFVPALNPGSVVGTANVTMFASVLTVASSIAWRRLPGPASAVVLTVKLAA